MATYLGTTINESPTIVVTAGADIKACLLYTSPSPRDS